MQVQRRGAVSPRTAASQSTLSRARPASCSIWVSRRLHCTRARLRRPYAGPRSRDFLPELYSAANPRSHSRRALERTPRDRTGHDRLGLRDRPHRPPPTEPRRARLVSNRRRWLDLGYLPMRVDVLIQLVSQVRVPSGENACSSRFEVPLISSNLNRTHVIRPLTGS